MRCTQYHVTSEKGGASRGEYQKVGPALRGVREAVEFRPKLTAGEPTSPLSLSTSTSQTKPCLSPAADAL